MLYLSVAQAAVEILQDGSSDTESSKNKVSVVYTRWGSHDCPEVEGTKFVYNGVVGATEYNRYGGAANYLCMPNDPEYDLKVSRAGVQAYSPLHGVEYEQPAPNGDKHDLNVPCAVCRVRGRDSKLMIPAKMSCPDKWTLEYQGFLMSGRASDRRTMFECIDRALESVSGSKGNNNGGRLFNVEATCNGIHCPPYYTDRELMCVVCTR